MSDGAGGVGPPAGAPAPRVAQPAGDRRDRPRTAAPGEHAPKPAGDGPQREFTAREALRTSAFWLLALGHGFARFVVTAVNVHAIKHMCQSLGCAVAQASIFIMLMTASQVAGVLLGAAVVDRRGKRWMGAFRSPPAGLDRPRGAGAQWRPTGDTPWTARHFLAA